MCHNRVITVLLARFSRRVSPETQRGVCEGRADGGTALSSDTAQAEAVLDQSCPPRGRPGADRGGLRADGLAGSWEEPRGSQCFCHPPGELFLFPGVKYKRTCSTFRKRS